MKIEVTEMMSGLIIGLDEIVKRRGGVQAVDVIGQLLGVIALSAAVETKHKHVVVDIDFYSEAEPLLIELGFVTSIERTEGFRDQLRVSLP